MRKKLTFLVNIILLILVSSAALQAQQKDDILGFWISSQKNVVVEIYSDSTHFRGKVIWFDDTDDPAHPMKTRMDVNNPLPALRTRAILGIDVLEGLVFNPKCKCWEDGKIYDTQTGKTWSASIFFDNINQVRVRGFWHFQFFGRSMTFTRYQFPKETVKQ